MIPTTAQTGAPQQDAVRYAHHRLREEILAERLPAGTVLSQVQLADELGISRTPLREALRRLTAERLVAGEFNQQMRVSELDLDDFDQIYAMRFALEPIALRATVPALSDAEKAALEHAVVGMDEAIDDDDREHFRRNHRAFHLGLTCRTGPRMVHTLEDLWDHSERYRLAYLHPGPAHDEAAVARLRISQNEHRAILAAAITGGSDQCVELLASHLRRTVEGVFREAAPERPAPRLAHFALGDEAEARSYRSRLKENEA